MKPLGLRHDRHIYDRAKVTRGRVKNTVRRETTRSEFDVPDQVEIDWWTCPCCWEGSDEEHRANGPGP